MKKKHRDIVVDNHHYTWCVVEMSWPKHVIRLWDKEQGKQPWCEVNIGEHITISPKHIENMIRNIKNELATDSEDGSASKHTFEFESVCTNYSLE